MTEEQKKFLQDISLNFGRDLIDKLNVPVVGKFDKTKDTIKITFEIKIKDLLK